MLNNIFRNISTFFINVFDFFVSKNKPALNNDVESCCVLLNDDTNTFSE
jgi:hypothetical protein